MSYKHNSQILKKNVGCTPLALAVKKVIQFRGNVWFGIGCFLDKTKLRQYQWSSAAFLEVALLVPNTELKVISHL